MFIKAGFSSMDMGTSYLLPKIVGAARHAIEIENRTQILTGFTNNPTEAARAHRDKRPPVWDPL